ncbi:39S ribosomal protein L18, mitochondrial [Diorhabda carinulata]|uniref:39S ribosomal protein L18, mitochondrial n=1 Tax=Diorhabda carinulata TaxID=1163345 RepID=UPI0025A1FA7A|nr:39S ribosomal protein L18, mitochondrial [Diorhabda carinulata]
MFKSYNFICLLNTLKQCRFGSTTQSGGKNEVATMLTNRNPRNLERLRIGYKPDGYHVDALGKRYWHKLQLTASGKYVKASIVHFQNGEVLSANTSEWCIKKQLYRTIDTSAYINLGRVLAQRCLQSGLIEVECFIKSKKPDDKVALFLQAMQEGGVSLTEPSQFKAAMPWDLDRPEKPWEVTE